MKRARLFLSFSLLLFTAWQVGADSDALRLEMRPKPGDAWLVTESQDIKMEMALQDSSPLEKLLAGMAEEGEEEESTTLTLEEGQAFMYAVDCLGADESEATLAFTFLAVKTKNAMPLPFGRQAMGLVYDSTDPLSVPDFENLGLAYLPGIRFKMVYSPTGQVVRFEGLDELAEDLGKAAKLTKAQQRAVADGFKAKWDEMRADTEESSLYPQREIKIGDTWDTLETRMVSGVKVEMHTTYTFEAREGGLAVISMRAAVEGAGAIEESGLKVDITGEQTGTYKIDEATGWIMSAEITQHFDLAAEESAEETGDEASGQADDETVGENGEEQEPLQMNMKMTGTYRLTSTRR